MDSQTQPDASPADEAQHADPAARLAEQEARIARLTAELARQRRVLQQAEIALIARIGDVDDDRRQADTRLQRAWQTQHVELEARFKRQRSLTAGVLLLFGILIGLTAVFFHVQLNRMWQDMAEEVTQLRLTLDQQLPRAGSVPQDQVIQDKLSSLSIALQSIYPTLKTVEQDAAPTASAVQPDSSQAIGAPDAAESPIQPLPAPPESVETEAQAEPALTEDSLDPAPEPTPLTPVTLSDPPAAPVQEQTPEQPPEPPPTDTSTSDSRSPAPDAADAAPADTAGAAAAPRQIPVGDRPYAIQLIGVPSRDALQTFLEHFQLTAQIVYYREETYRRRPWFALIHSLHESRESAQAALATLPPELSALKIWVRRLDPASVVTVVDPAVYVTDP